MDAIQLLEGIREMAEKRDKRVITWLTEAEQAELTAISELSGMPMSVILRRGIDLAYKHDQVLALCAEQVRRNLEAEAEAEAKAQALREKQGKE